jgi:hypothetical protein
VGEFLGWRAFSSALADPVELQWTDAVGFAADVPEAVHVALALPGYDAAMIERRLVSPAGLVDVPDELLPLVVAGLTIVMDRSAWDGLRGWLRGVLHISPGGHGPGHIAGVTALAAQLRLGKICAE